MSSDLENILKIAVALGHGGKINPVPDSTGYYIRCPLFPSDTGNSLAVIGRRFVNGEPSLECKTQLCPEETMKDALRKRGLWFWDKPEGGKVEIVDGNSTPESRRLHIAFEQPSQHGPEVLSLPPCTDSSVKEKKAPDFTLHNHIGTGIDAALVKKLASAGHRLATAIEALVVELKGRSVVSELQAEREAIQTEELNQIINSYTDDGSIPF